jgi:amidase
MTLSEAEYLSRDATDLAELVRRGAVSPAELVETAIGRIERLNPALNAVIHRMDERARDGARHPAPGPFRGVPLLIKDLMVTVRDEPFTCGSAYLRGYRAPEDSELIARYRRAGFVFLGKTNTPEFGLTPFTEPAAFGPTRNPWDLSRTAGGSSGGSAAAVASGMVPVATGGDGGGSIRIPASCCGLFGLKPTRGRTPVGPRIGEAWRGAVVDHVLSRSVRDSAAILDWTAGPDCGAPYFAPPPEGPWLAELGKPPGRLRVAFTETPWLGHRVHDDCRAAVRDGAALLEHLGHSVEEAGPEFDGAGFARAFLAMICVELRTDLVELEALVGRKGRVADFEPATRALSLLGGAMPAEEYARAVRRLQGISRVIAGFFERYDVLLTPTVAAPPFPTGALQPLPGERALLAVLGRIGSGALFRWAGALDQMAEKVFDWIPWTPVANATGQPAMSVPLFWNGEGLPIGLHVMARYGEEAILFRLARQLEEARPWFDRRPPLALS